MQQISKILSPELFRQEARPLATSSKKSRSVEELRELLLDYSPQKQSALCRSEELCYFGESPTLATLNNEYDEQAGILWLIPQLTDIAVFSNSTGVLTKEQIRMLAELIVTDYYYLKLTELMMFFHRFKASRYGQFYGNISPMTITNALRAFMRERMDVYCKHEEKEQRKRREESLARSISWEEYCQQQGTPGKPHPLEMFAPASREEEKKAKASKADDESFVLKYARDIITSGLVGHLLANIREKFAQRYGATPEQYISTHQTVQQ